MAQAFMQMIGERSGHQLDAWRSRGRSEPFARVQVGGFRPPTRQGCGAGRLDAANVSQGPRDRHVNRLKLLKRSMYGRAKLPRLASTRASCGADAACSRSFAGWIAMRLTSSGEQVGKQRKQMGTIEAIHDEPKQGGQ
ncbi:MAG TPA: hypothetical protein VKB35_14325 [Ktedonobacteraceae bacterium]|nr:hypothetical protein [Ktedonobacteraceae bacterium]